MLRRSAHRISSACKYRPTTIPSLPRPVAHEQRLFSPMTYGVSSLASFLQRFSAATLLRNERIIDRYRTPYRFPTRIKAPISAPFLANFGEYPFYELRCIDL